VTPVANRSTGTPDWFIDDPACLWMSLSPKRIAAVSQYKQGYA